MCWRQRSDPVSQIVGTPGVSGGAFRGSDSRGPSWVVFPAQWASPGKMLPASMPHHCRGPLTGMDINQGKPRVGRPEEGALTPSHWTSRIVDHRPSRRILNRKESVAGPTGKGAHCISHQKLLAPAPQPETSPHHPGLPLLSSGLPFQTALPLPSFSINNVPLICWTCVWFCRSRL